MSNSQDPRVILSLIEEADKRFNHWGAAIVETSDETEYQLRLTQEHLSRSRGTVQSTIDEALRCDRDVSERLERACLDLLKADDNFNEVSNGVTRAKNALSKAANCVSHCRTELNRAEGVRDTCEHEHGNAELGLKAAHHQVLAAKSKLEDADSSYSRCLDYRDSEGRRRDCSDYKRGLVQAKAYYDTSCHYYHAAEELLNRTVVALNKAIEAVDSCSCSLEAAKKGETHASAAVEKSTIALQAADESVSNARTAILRGEEAKKTALRMIEISKEMQTNLSNAESQIENAKSDVFQARQLESDAMSLLEGLRGNLAEAAEKLREFEIQSL